MGKGTAISWATDTFNLWWGCEHAGRDDPDGIDADPAAISEECRNCYAETFDHRIGGRHWGPGAEPRWFGHAYWAKLRRWNTEARATGVRRRVFVSSMADWAQRHRDPTINAQMDAARARLWGEVRACPWLDFLLLTKRAERLTELLPWHTALAPGRMPRDDAQEAVSAPWPNVWVGVTCGARSSLWRIAKLRQVPAALRFVSCEPLLERITSEDWDYALGDPAVGEHPFRTYPIDWLIVGDESGAHRRAAHLDWVRTAREAAARHSVAFHFKQWNTLPGAENRKNKTIHLPVLDGRQHAAFPRGPR